MTEEQQAGRAGRLRAAALVAGAGVVVLAAGAWLLLADGESTPETLGVLDEHRPAVGEPAPDFALVDVRDGETVRRLSDYRGRVVILNWYASWCGPCRAEIPDFQEAYSHLSEEMVILGLNLQETRDAAAGLLEELGAEYPAVLDSDGEVAQHYRVGGLPTTVFIDAEGNLFAEGRGIITEDALREQLGLLGLKYP